MKNSERVSWDTYFMNIATMVATRSTCPRKSVGAVIVKGNAILSTGYNGSMSGAPHCTDVGCMIENDHCVGTIHAEANAIIHAARRGLGLHGIKALGVVVVSRAPHPPPARLPLEHVVARRVVQVSLIRPGSRSPCDDDLETLDPVVPREVVGRSPAVQKAGRFCGHDTLAGPLGVLVCDQLLHHFVRLSQAHARGVGKLLELPCSAAIRNQARGRATLLRSRPGPADPIARN